MILGATALVTIRKVAFNQNACNLVDPASPPKKISKDSVQLWKF